MGTRTLLAGVVAAGMPLGPALAAPPPAAPASRPIAVAAPTSAAPADRWPGSAAMVDRLATALERDATAGDWALARLYRMWNYHRLLGHEDRVERALQAVAKRGTPLVRDHARYLQATLLRRRGRVDEARAQIRSLGLITDGWLIGPFDNAAGGGHDAEYGPERRVELGAELDNRGRPLRWRRLDGLAPDGAIELAPLLPASEEATAYVAAVAYASRSTTAALRVGAADALKVWLKGRKVLDKNSQRFGFVDQETVAVNLRKGANLLLLKSSWTRGEGKLFVRLTAPEGGPSPTVRWSSSPERIAQATARRPARTRRRPTRVRSPATAMARRPKRVSPPEWLALRADLVAVMGLYDQRRLPSPGEQWLREAIAMTPGDPAYRFVLGHRVKERDPSLARAQMSAALTADPGFAPAWLALAEMARDGDRFLEAVAHLERARRADAELVAAHLTRATIGFRLLEEGVLAARRLQKAPGATENALMRAQLGRMYRALDNNRLARAHFKAALEGDHTLHTARQALVDLALDADDRPAALALVAEQVRLQPWSIDHRLRQVRLTHENDPEGARRLLVQTESLFSTHPEVPALRAELALFDDQRAVALAALDRSLALDPYQPSLRRHRRRLAGEGQDLAQTFGVDALQTSRQPVSEAEKAFGAAYLADRTAVQLVASGRSTKFRQQVIRLQDARLKDPLRAHRIYFSPSREDVEILTAEQIKKDGQVLKPATIQEGGPQGKVGGMYIDQRYKVVVFGELEPGDTIHIAYRIDSRGENIFGGFFGDVFAAQGALPKRDVQYTIVAPKSRPLYHATIRLPEPQVTSSDDTHRLQWRLTDVEALDYEPMAPPYPHIGRMLSVSTYDAWAGLGKWYARLYADQLELDDSARAAGRAAVAGAQSDAEKVRRLYAYVVKNTRYVGIELGIHGWKPYKASEVHRRLYGDCKDKATLLSALLRDNGVDATITLVRTSDRGQLPKDHATMWAFNHAITYVPALDLFLDPTAEFNGSTELPYQDQGAMALVVHPDGRTKLTTLPVSSARDNLNASEYDAELKKDGRLIMKGQERFLGARAAELRQELEEKDQRQRLLERQLSQLFPGVVIRDLSVSDVDVLEKPVSYRYHFEVPNYGQLDKQRWLVPVALYRHEVSRAYAQLPARKHAIHLPHAWETNNVIRYRIPDGAQIGRLPEGVTVDTPYISLRQTVRRIPGGFETNDTVTVKRREIPAKAYDGFRQACLAIDRAMNRKVEIQW